MAKARRRSQKRTELNWWTRNIFLPRSDGMLCKKLKLLKNIGPAMPAQPLLLPIKIDTALWALSHWTEMVISLLQLRLAAQRTSDRGVWVIRRSLAQELMRTMRPALSPRR